MGQTGVMTVLFQRYTQDYSAGSQSRENVVSFQNMT